jgi:hypothetical protein
MDQLLTSLVLSLAIAAALLSSSTEAPREVAGYFADAFKPQTADLGGDPGYLLGMSTETVWALPPSPGSISREADAPLLRAAD